jgi:CubicO group peptidase (beta-lactamase class C family)
VIEAGQLRWSGGYGLTTNAAGAGTAIDANTLFQACSISKAIAAVATMRLVQEGRLDLDTDVNGYLQSWHLPANGTWQPRVTLRHLLSHSAGLTTCWYPGYRRGAASPTTRQTLAGVHPANTPPVRATALPGTQFRYSGSHYSVLQQVLSDQTGMPFGVLVRDLVFSPLRMDSSGYEIDWPERSRGATALGHDAGGEPIAGGWRDMPESAAAGLWTTPTDLCLLACDILAAWSGRPAQILTQETARQMLTAQIGGWGLGWGIATSGGSLLCGHGGSNIGYKCRLEFWPEEGVGAAVMTNADEGTALVQEAFAAIGREYRWPNRVGAQDAPPAPDTAHDYRALVGSYGGGDRLPRVDVADIGDQLLLRFAGQPDLPLRAVGPDRFIAEALATELVFTRDAGGSVQALRLIQHGDEALLERIERDG